MKLEITESQAQNLMDLIDLWFYREIREDTDLDNVMWAWEILDIYKQCKEGINGSDSEPTETESKKEADDDITEELLEVHLKTKTKSGKHKMLSWFNFKNPRDAVLKFDEDHEKYFGREMSFSIKCDGWDTCITDV